MESSGADHIFYNHRINLIKSVVSKYFSIKINYILKNRTTSKNSKRIKFNKLIIFSGN